MPSVRVQKSMKQEAYFLTLVGTQGTYLLKKEMNPSTGSGRAGYETRNTFHEILKRRLEYGTKSRF
jgi:hypothetical protein